MVCWNLVQFRQNSHHDFFVKFSNYFADSHFLSIHSFEFDMSSHIGLFLSLYKIKTKKSGRRAETLPSKLFENNSSEFQLILEAGNDGFVFADVNREMVFQIMPFFIGLMIVIIISCWRKRQREAKARRYNRVSLQDLRHAFYL